MQNITESTLKSFLTENPHVVLDFWAPTCNPCRTLAPILEAIEKEFSGKVVIAKINIEEESTLANEYRIQSLPTLIFFQDGEPVGQAGFQTRRELVERFKTLGWL